VVLVLAGYYLPLVGGLITFLWPVPIAVVVLRHGLRLGIMTVLTAGLILSMVVGVVQGALLGFTLGAGGLILGWGWLRGWNAGRMVAVSAVGQVAVIMVTLASFRILLSIDLLALTLGAVSQAMEASISIYSRLGVSGYELGQMEALAAAVIELMPLVLPSGVVLGSVFTAYLNFLVARGVLRRLGHQAPALPPFSRWQVPVYALVAFAASLTLRHFFKDGTLFRLGFNLFYVIYLAFVVQGLSLAYFFLERLSVPRAFRVIILVVTVLRMEHIYALAGLVEVGLGVRAIVEARDARRPPPERRNNA